MINFYVNAVKYNYLTIDKVPPNYIDEVKRTLGITNEIIPKEV